MPKELQKRNKKYNWGLKEKLKSDLTADFAARKKQ
jgi:hypothetical protein